MYKTSKDMICCYALFDLSHCLETVMWTSEETRGTLGDLEGPLRNLRSTEDIVGPLKTLEDLMTIENY